MDLFGQKIRYLRLLRGLTQTHLATKLGLTTNAHISYLERQERHPSLALAHQLACVFDVSLEYLLRDEIPIEPLGRWETSDTGTAMLHFGQKLRALRTRHTFTQKDLAQRLGLKTHTHISELESHDKEPSIAVLVSIADVFQCSIDDLIRDSVQL